eukprot:TRINITY_DN3386_c0_g1_i5.p1 TRINITY_DN3386_c0_g1~~TRINITY_DN3386_c0_g1_i5.p1  ORF type:complete len:619 (+),score=259.81 TRINITY_DN3386_c0_g1_i5:47-1903(+)
MFSGGKGVKQRYHITFERANGLPDGARVVVAWKRGNKKGNKGATVAATVAKGGTCEWNETVTMSCTLFKDGSKYDNKNIVFTLKQEPKKGKKTVSLGKVTVDLADYADLGGSTKAASVAVKKKGSKNVMTLFLKLSSENLGQATGDEETEVLKSENEDDDEEEEKVDFESDSAKQEQASKYEGQLAALQEECGKLRREIAELDKLRGQVTILTTERDQLLEKGEKAKRRHESAKQKLKEATAKLEEKEKLVCQKEKEETSALHEKLDTLSAERDQLIVTVKQLKESMNSSESRSAELDGTLKQMKQVVDKVSESREKDKAKEKKLKARIAELETSLKQSQDELTQMQEQNEKVLGSLSSLTKVVKQVERERDDMGAKLRQISEAETERMEPLHARIRELTTQLQDYQEKATSADRVDKQQIQLLQQEMKTLLSKTAEANIAKQQANIAQQQEGAGKAQLGGRVQVLEAELKQRAAEMCAAKAEAAKEIAALKAQLEEVAKGKSALNELNIVKAENKELMQRLLKTEGKQPADKRQQQDELNKLKLEHADEAKQWEKRAGEFEQQAQQAADAHAKDLLRMQLSVSEHEETVAHLRKKLDTQAATCQKEKEQLLAAGTKV